MINEVWKNVGTLKKFSRKSISLSIFYFGKQCNWHFENETNYIVHASATQSVWPNK